MKNPENNILFLPSGAAFRPSRLRDARVAASLSISDLASAVGVSRLAIAAYEQGQTEPDQPTLATIADCLGQPKNFFTTDDAPSFGPLSCIIFCERSGK